MFSTFKNKSCNTKYRIYINALSLWSVTVKKKIIKKKMQTNKKQHQIKLKNLSND